MQMPVGVLEKKLESQLAILSQGKFGFFVPYSDPRKSYPVVVSNEGIVFYRDNFPRPFHAGHRTYVLTHGLADEMEAMKLPVDGIIRMRERVMDTPRYEGRVDPRHLVGAEEYRLSPKDAAKIALVRRQ